MTSGPADNGNNDARPVERLTIGLISEAAEAIRQIQGHTGLKKVDIINRAVVIYEFLDTELQQGKQLVLRGKDGTEERIKILPL